MANNLNRDIQIGERIVLHSRHYKGTEAERTVEVVGGGFGLQAATMGRAIVVRFPDGEECRVNGDEIDREATERLQGLGGAS